PSGYAVPGQARTSSGAGCCWSAWVTRPKRSASATLRAGCEPAAPGRPPGAGRSPPPGGGPHLSCQFAGGGSDPRPGEVVGVVVDDHVAHHDGAVAGVAEAVGEVDEPDVVESGGGEGCGVDRGDGSLAGHAALLGRAAVTE